MYIYLPHACVAYLPYAGIHAMSITMFPLIYFLNITICLLKMQVPPTQERKAAEGGDGFVSARLDSKDND